MGSAWGGGGGGGARIEPVAIVEVTDGKIRVEPIVNVTKLVAIGALARRLDDLLGDADGARHREDARG